MIAFEVHLNEEKLCVASVGEEGTLFQNLIYSRRRQEAQAGELAAQHTVDFHVSGLENREHTYWGERSMTIKVGDEITVRIVEVESADAPTQRHRSPTDEERQSKVRQELAAIPALLPSPLIEGEFLASLRGYEELMAAGESEIAVKTLAKLGELNDLAPAFWEQLKNVAAKLQMYDEATSYRAKAKSDEDAK